MSEMSTVNMVATPSDRYPHIRYYYALLAVIVLAVGILIPQLIGSRLLLTLMVPAIINAILATSVGMLFKFNGVISFGHAAFYGLGLYTMGLAINRLGLAPELAIVLALIIPSVFALVLGLQIVGISGAAFAMLTLAVGQAVYEIALKARGLTNGDDGFSFEMPATLFGLDASFFQEPETMFIVCWVVLIVVIWGLALLARTRFGRVAIAIRENEERARFIGYTTRLRRALIFAISAFLAALAGVMTGLYSAYTSPEALSTDVSGSTLIMAVTGGAAMIWGPAFGAIIFFFLKDILGEYTEHWQAMLGIVVILVIVLLPRGIGGAANDFVRSAFRRKVK